MLNEWLNKFIQGDCLELLGMLPDNCIDMSLCSPPYDGLREYMGYQFKFEETAKQLFRVLKSGGVLVWIVNDQTTDGSESGTSFSQALFFKSLGFRLHDTMIWEKVNPPPHDPRCHRYTPSFEYMFVLSKGKPKTCNYLTEKCLRSGNLNTTGTMRNVDGSIRQDRKEARKHVKIQRTKPRSNIWRYPTASKSFHPAPFPLALAQDHILTWTNIGDVVLDPMAGSGTTLKAAKKLDRVWLGFDVSQHYIDQANKELKDTAAFFPGFNALLET